jgi:hypothetical protein
MSKADKLLEGLRKNLYWDGHAYWLPDLCIKEQDGTGEETPEPTKEEFLAVLADWIEGQK